ncbi:FmdC precursor [Cytophagales bacterium RKSG123]|nr:FmdC precursor [Xanthovirga aplysinae]
MLLLSCKVANAQKVNYSYGKGIRFNAEDSTFSLKMGARFQSLYDGSLNLSSGDWNDQLLIRRFRLKFDGFAYDPSVTYKLELGLSNRDNAGGHEPEFKNAANLVLDAYVRWKFYRNLSVQFGQTKLPGNRERVISSQKLQFVDRSLLNKNFSLDRDAGVQFLNKSTSGKMVIKQIFSVSMGEGRNVTNRTNKGGYDLTGRLEFLPFGEFMGGGDYFSSDLAREKSPKLSVGVTYDYNSRAARTKAQLGDFTEDYRARLQTFFADAMFKYNGFSAMAEYVDRRALEYLLLEEEATLSGAEQFYYTGQAFNLQAGYLFKSNYEIAARFTIVNPQEFTLQNDVQEYTLGFSKYIVGHTLKVQSDLRYIDEANTDGKLGFRLQMEFGF